MINIVNYIWPQHDFIVFFLLMKLRQALALTAENDVVLASPLHAYLNEYKNAAGEQSFLVHHKVDTL